MNYAMLKIIKEKMDDVNDKDTPIIYGHGDSCSHFNLTGEQYGTILIDEIRMVPKVKIYLQTNLVS